MAQVIWLLLLTSTLKFYSRRYCITIILLIEFFECWALAIRSQIFLFAGSDKSIRAFLIFIEQIFDHSVGRALWPNSFFLILLPTLPIQSYFYFSFLMVAAWFFLPALICNCFHVFKCDLMRIFFCTPYIKSDELASLTTSCEEPRNLYPFSLYQLVKALP